MTKQAPMVGNKARTRRQMLRALAKGDLRKDRAAYRDGDKSALLSAIFTCATAQLPLPRWLADEFRHAVSRVRFAEARSWDDVFGRPHPKNKQLSAIRRRLQLSFPIYKTVREISQAGAAIDGELFAAVGKLHRVSGSTARDLYYPEEKRLARSRHPALQARRKTSRKSKTSRM